MHEGITGKTKTTDLPKRRFEISYTILVREEDEEIGNLGESKLILGKTKGTFLTFFLFFWFFVFLPLQKLFTVCPGLGRGSRVVKKLPGGHRERLGQVRHRGLQGAVPGRLPSALEGAALEEMPSQPSLETSSVSG